MPQQKIRVVVCVSGGVVTAIGTDSPSLVDAIVVDFDEAEDAGITEQEALQGKTFADGTSALELDEPQNWIY